MTFVSFFGSFWTLIWSFLRLPFPGTSIPIAAFLFMPVTVELGISLLRQITGFGGMSSVSGVHADYQRIGNKRDTEAYQMHLSQIKGRK